MNRTSLAVLTACSCCFVFGTPAVSAAADAGYLHGKLTTRDGATYEGRMRWDDEEASWVDFFNSSKAENPWVEDVPRRIRRSRGESIKLFGVEIARRSGDEGRQFVARFGDIAKIRVDHGDEASVWMKSGTRFAIEGGSNDVEAAVTVWDPKVGEIQVPWRRIDTLEFSGGEGSRMSLGSEATLSALAAPTRRSQGLWGPVSAARKSDSVSARSA